MYDSAALVAQPLLLEPLRRAVASGAPPAYLRSAKLKLTARCNLRCTMCKYGRGDSPPELDGDVFVRVVRELAATGGQKVHFSGGEVLARRDFEAILGAACDAGMKATFTSNLTLLTPERAKAILRHKVSSISTSLDGADKKTHDAIRGMDGAWKRTTRAIARLADERARRNRRTRLRVNFVMMRDNVAEYPALVERCASLGVTELYPMPVDEKTKSTRRLSRRLIRHYNAEIAPRVRDARARAGYSVADAFVFPFGRDDDAVKESAAGRYAQGYYRRHLCFAPWTHLFIRWDGDTALCCMTNGRIASLGNVATEGVAGVFFGARYQAIRAEMRRARLAACHRCDMFIDENRVLEAGLGAARRPLPVLDDDS